MVNIPLSYSLHTHTERETHTHTHTHTDLGQAKLFPGCVLNGSLSLPLYTTDVQIKGTRCHLEQSVGSSTHLVEHVSQVVFRADPGRHGITEEDEVLQRDTFCHFNLQKDRVSM